MRAGRLRRVISTANLSDKPLPSSHGDKDSAANENGKIKLRHKTYYVTAAGRKLVLPDGSQSVCVVSCCSCRRLGCNGRCHQHHLVETVFKTSTIENVIFAYVNRRKRACFMWRQIKTDMAGQRSKNLTFPISMNNSFFLKIFHS